MKPISVLLANLEAWFETMRGPGGYGGPVVHWWQSCLSYTGPGLDWRYEGIISGYLTLWERTGEQRWLEKACRAGDDLVKGQLPSGNYRHSCFELNPYSGGTPHEAAASLGLLRLALALREIDDARWSAYAGVAEDNLNSYYVARLWDQEGGSFRDHPDTPSLVPNKVCTLVEALFAWAELHGDEQPIAEYGLPALRAVVALQLTGPGPLTGAIPQNRIRSDIVEAYYPYYIARCAPAFLLAYQYTAEQEWLDAAVAAFAFISRQVDENSLLPQVLYRRGRNRFPQWIAPLGDVLHSARLLEPYGLSFELEAMELALLGGQLPSGGFATGRGFGAQISQRPGDVNPSRPDFRDNLPVAGWNDKTFHYLATRLEAGASLPPAELDEVSIDCHIRKRPAVWNESEGHMGLSANQQTIYAWLKYRPWTEMTRPDNCES